MGYRLGGDSDSADGRVRLGRNCGRLKLLTINGGVTKVEPGLETAREFSHKPSENPGPTTLPSPFGTAGPLMSDSGLPRENAVRPAPTRLSYLVDPVQDPVVDGGGYGEPRVGLVAGGQLGEPGVGVCGQHG